MRTGTVCFAQRTAACLGYAGIEGVPAPAWYSQNVSRCPRIKKAKSANELIQSLSEALK